MLYFYLLTVFIIDRLAKLLVMINISSGISVPVAGFFNLTHIYNTGAAFSLFQSRNNILILINTVIIIALLVGAALSRQKDRLVICAYGLIAGGALSNLADRVMYGAVVDYLDFKIWPVFNLADAAITIGAGLILIDIAKNYRKERGVLKNAS